MELRRVLPIPALLVIAWILVLSDDVWVVRTYTRSGPGSTYGTVSVFAAAVLTMIYYAAPAIAPFLGRARGVRTPTETEIGCAGGLLRVLALGALFVVAYSLVKRFG